MVENCKLYGAYWKYGNFSREWKGWKIRFAILTDEVSYRLSLYTEEGTCTGEEYKEAVQFLKEVRGGKIPCWNTIPPIPKYTPIQLENKTKEAKAVVNEYKRLVSLMNRLNERGYYARWL